MKLTPGKLAGMKAVSNDRGVIAAAAMDQRGSLKKALGANAGDKELTEFKVAVSEILTPHASAILLEPRIADRIVVVWLGGEPWYWEGPQSIAFNLYQDVPAARVIFDSGVPLVHVPCSNVSEHLRTTLPELARYVRGRGAVGDYLYGLFEDHYPDHFARSKEIWDVAAIAYCLNPDWTPSALRPSPILRDDLSWAPTDPTRHLIREVLTVRRDAVFGGLFQLLAERA
jgi:hypothetical protein